MPFHRSAVKCDPFVRSHLEKMTYFFNARRLQKKNHSPWGKFLSACQCQLSWQKNFAEINKEIKFWEEANSIKKLLHNTFIHSQTSWMLPEFLMGWIQFWGYKPWHWRQKQEKQPNGQRKQMNRKGRTFHRGVSRSQINFGSTNSDEFTVVYAQWYA